MAKKSNGGVKRKNAQFPGLDRELHPKSRWEYLDQDYHEELDDEEKAFLSKFNDEYYGGAFKETDNLHLDEQKRECYTRNNARNRDLYTLYRTKGWIASLQDKINDVEESQVHNVESQENAVIELLDVKKVVQNTGLKNRKKSTRGGSGNNT